MKSGVSYNGGSVNSLTEEAVKALIKNELTGLIIKVTLDTVPYSIPANTCLDVKIPYNDSIPSGYTAIGFSDLDVNLGTGTCLPIKRLHVAFGNENADIAFENTTSNVFDGKVSLKVICIKSDYLKIYNS